MKPKYLKLKGFKGIKNGMGLDEVTLDCSKLPPGIIVFSAPNGGGKTTNLDSMTPYRLMPYRSNGSYTVGSLWDHCFNDYERDFIFEMDGETYRSLITGDANRKKEEAYLYIKRGEKWAPLPGIDGKLGAYDSAVETLIGNPTLFFNSVFRCQNAKSLSDYSKGDIKEIFCDLLNINHLKAISEKAKTVKNSLNLKIENLNNQKIRYHEDIKAAEQAAASKEETETAIMLLDLEIESLNGEIAKLQKELTDIEVRIGLQATVREDREKAQKNIEAEKAKLDALQKSADSKKAQYEEKNRAFETKLNDIDQKYDAKGAAVKAKIGTAETLIKSAGAIKQTAAQKEAFEIDLVQLKNGLATLETLFTENNEKLQKIKDIETQIAKKEAEKGALTSERTNQKVIAIRELAEAEKGAQKLKTVPCTKDVAAQCRFVKDAAEAENKIDDLRCDVEFFSGEYPAVTKLEGEIAELNRAITGKGEVIQALNKILADKKALSGNITAKEQELTTVDRALVLLPKIELAEQQLPELKKELEGIEAEKIADRSGVLKEQKAAFEEYERESDVLYVETDLRKKDIETLEERLSGIIVDTSLDTKKTETETAITTKTGEITTKRTEGDALKQKLGGFEAVQEAGKKARAEMEATGEKVLTLQKEMSEWATLEKAFGDNGIVALELDDSGPQISALTNELLKAFGGRFSVRIETQSAKSDGKGNKEVFEVLVVDNASGEVVSIKKKSGGERTWIEEALTKAIAIYNAQSSGRHYKAIFSDEKDGALDAEKKAQFWEMKRKVLELGGYEQEFCITQTPSLVSMADAVIVLKKGGMEVITNE